MAQPAPLGTSLPRIRKWTDYGKYKSKDAILLKSKCENVPCWISIVSLNSELNFVHPVIVKMSYNKGDFIAECPKFNIFAFGNTYNETLDNLKEILIEDYKTYLDDYPDKLSHSGKKLLKLYLDFLG